jgi:LysR family transcriptional regulator, cys regulon transcriptional activator
MPGWDVFRADAALEMFSPWCATSQMKRSCWAYEAAFTGRHLVSRAFDRAGLSPKVILSAIDADVIKTCVEQGLGIAILSEIVFQSARDTGLRAIPVGHLVEPAFTSIAMRRQRQLRAYEYDFISICSPDWTRAKVDRAAAVAPDARSVSTFAGISAAI